MRGLEAERKLSFEKTLESVFFIFLIVPFATSLLLGRLVQSFGYFLSLLADRFIDVYSHIVQQDLPNALKNLLRLHLVLHSFFGHFLRFYDSVPFWDKALHFFGPFTIALFFYSVLSRDSKFWRSLGDRMAKFVSFLLANFAGVLWEIAEFIADKLFSVNAQRGLDDTMFDLIFNAFGSYFSVLVMKKFSKERSA
ncbi:MAG: hypothetical protein H5T93_09800 [Pseudothermotoga sp.]|uniref:hypothetical protein n=1 Tax=Pseudothermotoga sp. TaxID=2033661 RepID=UPI0019C59CAE|nr:hypothetical protein [Pseudothermotoga sp.]MDK2923807.1 hypothetical protein [Pseudothermotoga sp.]